LSVRTKTMINPKTGLPVVFYEHYSLATWYNNGQTVSTDSLMTMMNSNITSGGYGPSYVDQVIQIQQGAVTHVQCHMWIAGSSPVDPITVMAILALIILAIAGIAVAWFIATSAQAVIERFFPQSKFYQMAKTGTGTFQAVEVDNQAEYVTCQRTAYPDGHVCPYCGQVFMAKQYGPPNDASQGTYDTDAEAITAEQTHEANCPWKSGVPGQPPTWMGLAIIGIGAVVVVGALWALSKVFGKGGAATTIIERR
jgi:hypothetical protein